MFYGDYVFMNLLTKVFRGLRSSVFRHRYIKDPSIIPNNRQRRYNALRIG